MHSLLSRMPRTRWQHPGSHASRPAAPYNRPPPMPRFRDRSERLRFYESLRAKIRLQSRLPRGSSASTPSTPTTTTTAATTGTTINQQQQRHPRSASSSSIYRPLLDPSLRARFLRPLLQPIGVRRVVFHHQSADGDDNDRLQAWSPIYRRRRNIDPPPVVVAGSATSSSTTPTTTPPPPTTGTRALAAIRRSPLLRSENFSRLSAVQQAQLVDAFLQKSSSSGGGGGSSGGDEDISCSAAAATFERAECFRLVMKPCAAAARWDLVEKLLRSYVESLEGTSGGVSGVSGGGATSATSACASDPAIAATTTTTTTTDTATRAYAHVVGAAIRMYADAGQLGKALALLQSVTTSPSSVHHPAPWTKPLTPTNRLVLPILESLLEEAVAVAEAEAQADGMTATTTPSSSHRRQSSAVPPALVMWTVLTHCMPLGYEPSPAVLMRVLRAIAATTGTAANATPETMEKLAAAQKRIVGMLLLHSSASSGDCPAPPPPSGVYAHLVRRCRSHESMLQLWNRSRRVGHWRTVFANHSVQLAFLETALSADLLAAGSTAATTTTTTALSSSSSSDSHASDSQMSSNANANTTDAMCRPFSTPSSRAWYWLHQWRRHDFPVATATYQRVGLLLAEASMRTGRITSDFQSVLNLVDQQPEMLDFRFTEKLLGGISCWRRRRRRDSSDYNVDSPAATAAATTTFTTTATIDWDDLHQRRKLMHRVLQQCLHENHRDGRAIPKYFPVSLVRAFGRVGDVQMCWRLWPLICASPHGQRVFLKALQQQPQPARMSSSDPVVTDTTTNSTADIVSLLQHLPADSPMIPDALLSLLDGIQTKRQLLAPLADTNQPLLQGRPYHRSSPSMLYNVLHASVDWHLQQGSGGGGGGSGQGDGQGDGAGGNAGSPRTASLAPLAADPQQQWKESLEQSLVALVQRLRVNEGRPSTSSTDPEGTSLSWNDPAKEVITRAVEELDSMIYKEI